MMSYVSQHLPSEYSIKYTHTCCCPWLFLSPAIIESSHTNSVCVCVMALKSHVQRVHSHLIWMGISRFALDSQFSSFLFSVCCVLTFVALSNNVCEYNLQSVIKKLLMLAAIAPYYIHTHTHYSSLLALSSLSIRAYCTCDPANKEKEANCSRNLVSACQMKMKGKQWPFHMNLHQSHE